MDIKLKLSKAIRQGAALRPMNRQGFFGYDDDDDTILCSCAMGAAYEATFGDVPYCPDSVSAAEDIIELLVSSYPELHTQLVIGGSVIFLNEYIADLNDNSKNGMTREAIADRLAELGY